MLSFVICQGEGKFACCIVIERKRSMYSCLGIKISVQTLIVFIMSFGISTSFGISILGKTGKVQRGNLEW